MAAVTAVEAYDRQRLFEIASLLLTYPDAELQSAIPEFEDALGHLEHDGVRECLVEFLGWFARTDAERLERHYVETFDLRRRSGLYLTYYLHGDTRKRGVALLTLKNRYKAHGLRLAEGELPDLLPVVLEFAAVAGPGDGEAPLRQHRRGIELLRASLDDSGSPYARLVEAIGLALPPLTDEDRDAIAALAVDGPPLEAVGLTPYGCPSTDFPVPDNDPFKDLR